MNKTQIQCWRAQLPQFLILRDKCISQITKIIIINPPENCDQKMLKIRKAIDQDYTSFCLQQYYDVICYLLQQRVNLPLNKLAQLFVQYFGLDKQFWSSKITQIATYDQFIPIFKIWHVNEQFQQHLNYGQNPIQIGAIKLYRKIAKQYLGALNSLIQKIEKIKITDSVQIIQSLYQKYHKEKGKYQTFIQKQNMPIQLQEETNVSMQRRKKAQSKLYNFPLAAQTVTDLTFGTNWQKIRKPSTNNPTLFNYSFNIDKRQTNNSNYQKDKTNYRNKSGQDYKRLYKVFQNLNNEKIQQRFGLVELRKQLQLNNNQNKVSRLNILKQSVNFDNQKLNSLSVGKQKKSNRYNFKKESFQQNKSLNSNQLNSQNSQQSKKMHFTSIWNDSYFFFYEGCPFSQKKISYAHPFNKNQKINYEIDSESEFEEIIGEDIDSDEQMSQCSELDESELNSLINDQLDNDPQATVIKFQNMFGPKWIFDHNSNKDQIKMMNFQILQIGNESQTLELQITEEQIKRKKQQKQRRKLKSKLNISKIVNETQQSDQFSQSLLQGIKTTQKNENDQIIKQQTQLGDQETRQISIEQKEKQLNILSQFENVQDDKNQCQLSNKRTSLQFIQLNFPKMSQIKQEQIQSSKVTSKPEVSNVTANSHHNYFNVSSNLNQTLTNSLLANQTTSINKIGVQQNSLKTDSNFRRITRNSKRNQDLINKKSRQIL